MTTKRSEEELQILWRMLDLEFFKLPPASHEQVAAEVLEWILWRERLRNNLEKSSHDRERSDRKTIAALKSMDSNDPMLLAAEKVFKRLANDQGDQAMRLVQAAIENKQAAFNNRQRKIAKKLRSKTQHPISRMISPIVEKNPKIKVNELFNALRSVSKNNPAAPCHFDFSKNEFITNDGKWHAIKRENLSDYLYRAKQRIKRASQLA